MIHYFASQEFGKSGGNRANRENGKRHKPLKYKEIRRWSGSGL